MNDSTFTILFDSISLYNTESWTRINLTIYLYRVTPKEI